MKEPIYWESPEPQLRYAEELSESDRKKLLEANTWKRRASLHPPAASIPLAPLSGPQPTDDNG
tara:strand:- start:376 stop:564 length:189 start_codon:yes stop_codon:yes gene_type:complete